MLAAGPAAGGLTRDHGQFRAEVVQMQEGHGPSDRPEPEGDGGTSPGASWVPWDSGQPGPQSYPVPPADLQSEQQQSEEQEAPAGSPTTELGTWTMSAGGQGTWEPPPGGGHGGWGPPPAGGYGQPGGGYGQPGGPQPERRRNRPLLYVLVAVVAAALGA